MINHGLQWDLALNVQREFERQSIEAELRRLASVSNDAEKVSKGIVSLPRTSLAARLCSLGRGILAHERLRSPA